LILTFASGWKDAQALNCEIIQHLETFVLIVSVVPSIICSAMKKFGAFLSLLGLLFQSSAQAWVGGPYGGNTYDNFTGGIFGGTIRGSGTSGIFKFSQGNEAYVSPFGDSIVYHGGLAYYGECYGFVDFDSKTVSGVTNGSNTGSNPNDPNASPFFRNVYGQGFGVSNGGAGIGITAGTAFAGSSSTQSNANSYWNGKITKSKQTTRFRAKGEISFFGGVSEIVVTDSTAATGTYLDPVLDLDTGLLIGGGSSNTPGNGTVKRVSTSDNNYPNIKDSVKIKVYGSRTSVQAAAVPTGYAN
jgi:hypothetical protein